MLIHHDHFPLSSAEVINGQNCISAPICFHGVDKDKFYALLYTTSKKVPHVHIVKETLWAPNLSLCFDEEKDFGIRWESKVESPNLLLSGPRHAQGDE